jgi:sialate O-acetylesterase
VGIIHSSYGGSRAETWVRRARLSAHPRLRALVTSTPPPPPAEATAAWRRAVAAWNAARPPVAPVPPAVAARFAAPAPAATGWRPEEIPRSAEVTPLPPPGSAFAPPPPPGPSTWWRRQVVLPAAFVGQPLVLRLGAIDSCDVTYVQGVRVGATCREQPSSADWPRAYPVPPALTTGRSLTIAVRVNATRGSDGLRGPRATMRLTLGSAPEGPSVALAGTWWWTREPEPTSPALAGPTPPAGTGAPRPTPPPGTRSYQMPGVLWDHMIADLVPAALAGVIWYQGESNTKRADQYRTLLPTLIADWRQAFEQARLPFLIVQLASHHPRWAGAGQRSEEEWPELREAQAAIAAADPASGLAVTLDVGARDDIHPLDKRTVGWRLALQALDRVYRQPIEHAGPTFAGFSREPEGRLRVRFQHAAGLAPGGRFTDRLFGFELAGRDRHYVNAEARIDGDTVLLSAPTVAAPVAVRYGWGDDPTCNLVNRAGLPALPFRTDRWPRLTAGRQLP